MPFFNSVIFTWNDAKKHEWLIIKRNLVSGFMNAYIHENIDKLSLDEKSILAAKQEVASLSSETKTVSDLHKAIINKLCFYQVGDTKLTEEIKKLSELSKDELIKKKDELVKLLSLKNAFEQSFETEKSCIIEQKESNHFRIQYILARSEQGYPLGFISTQLNYKTGKVYLRWVSLAPTVHHIGLGSQMLKQIAKHYNNSAFELYTRPSNPVAIGFYTKNKAEHVQIGSSTDLSFSNDTIEQSSIATLKTWLGVKKVYPPNDDGTDHPEAYKAFSRNSVRRLSI